MTRPGTTDTMSSGFPEASARDGGISDVRRLR